MKRCWFGAGMLVLLLIAGLTASFAMGNFQKKLGVDVAKSAEISMYDREEAQKKVEEVLKKWKKTRSLAAGLADHEPMNQADVLFALLTPEAETAAFRENALQLAEILRQLGQSHLPTLENIF